MSDDPQVLILGPRRGRPARAGERSRCRVEFVITAAEKTALHHVAELEGKKVADVIREATNEYVQDFGERRIFRAGPFE